MLKFAALAAAAGVCGSASASDAVAGDVLPAWSSGIFDIHHIDTARGNSTLLIFPDGTTMMIDAGAVVTAAAGTINPARPNGSRRPGEWLGRYALAHAPSPQIDYFLATHLHNDHIDGLADVDTLIPIGTFLDRGFPHYAANQRPPAGASVEKYFDLLRSRAAAGKRVEAVVVGSTRQIVPRDESASRTHFSARTLCANGNVWNRATGKVDAFLAGLPSSQSAHGYENNFSVATRFEYGPFSYFNGGDLNCDTFDGRSPALDTETPAVRSAGRTEVALADHHGYFDACGPAFTKALDAQAYVIPAWDIGHPGSAQMQRMLGAWDDAYSDARRDVFSLELLPQNALLNRRFAGQLKSQSGHVVIRVAPGGRTYMIYTIDSTLERGHITGVFGPYTSRA